MFWTDRVRRRTDRQVDPALADRPVINGLRHRTSRVPSSLDKAVARLLCGLEYSDGANRGSPHIYDCHACEDVHREHKDGPS